MKYFSALIGLSLIASQALACFHYSNSFTGKLEEGRKEVFLFHDGKDAHMVIRTSLSADKFPKEIAWVLPIPSVPLKIEEIDGPIFEELNGLFPQKSSLGGSFAGGTDGIMKGRGSSIKVHETVTLSQFVIQPIEILKDGSAAEFNEWLTKNKFNPMPVENQKYYLKKGAVFLAIRMSMNRPDLATIKSRPLHIVYRADQVSVPIKFSHDSRVFGMDLYVWSKNPLKKEFNGNYVRKEIAVPYKNEHLHPMMDNRIGPGAGFITRYVSENLNGPGRSLKELSEDPTFMKADLL